MLESMKTQTVQERVIALREQGVAVKAIMGIIDEEDWPCRKPVKSSFIYSIIRRHKEQQEMYVFDRMLVEQRLAGDSVEEIAKAHCINIGRVINALRRYNSGELESHQK